MLDFFIKGVQIQWILVFHRLGWEIHREGTRFILTPDDQVVSQSGKKGVKAIMVFRNRVPLSTSWPQ